MHSNFKTLGKYLLFTRYLSSTNMPTAQQIKGHKIKRKKETYWSHTAQRREALL